jgi:hypothetical protein
MILDTKRKKIGKVILITVSRSNTQLFYYIRIYLRGKLIHTAPFNTCAMALKAYRAIKDARGIAAHTHKYFNNPNPLGMDESKKDLIQPEQVI